MLTFINSTMGAGKTARAIMEIHHRRLYGQKVWGIKPSIDTRDGITTISSRIGLEATVDVIHPEDSILTIWSQESPVDVIIADEAQFFTTKQVEELKAIADTGVEVLCYGLKTDFQSKLFEGSKRLVELADIDEPIRAICSCGCNRKAVVNARVQHDKIVVNGPQLEMGGSEKYRAMCWTCYNKARAVSGQPVYSPISDARMKEIVSSLLTSIDDTLYEFSDKLMILENAGITPAELKQLGFDNLSCYLEEKEDC